MSKCLRPLPLSALALLLGAALNPTAAGSITALSEGNDLSFSQAIANAARNAQSQGAIAAQQREGATGRAVFVKPGSGGDQLASEAGASDSDLAWARGNMSLLGLARQFGVQTNRELSFRREADRFYVGAEGMGGSWFADADRAQAHLFQLLVNDSTAPAETRSALASGSGGLLESVDAAANAVRQKRVFLNAGADTKIKLTSDNFVATGLPQVVGPPGTTVSQVKRESADTITAVVRTDRDVTPGARFLMAFNPGHSYKRADQYEIFVNGTATASSGTATQATPTRDNAPELKLNEPVEGMLKSAREEGLHRIALSESGRLTVRSSGSTDVKLVIEDENGVVLGSDDDGGGWYHAKLAADLGPGIYFVRVLHCCRGTGAYTLSASLGK